MVLTDFLLRSSLNRPTFRPRSAVPDRGTTPCRPATEAAHANSEPQRLDRFSDWTSHPCFAPSACTHLQVSSPASASAFALARGKGSQVIGLRIPPELSRHVTVAYRLPQHLGPLPAANRKRFPAPGMTILGFGMRSSHPVRAKRGRRINQARSARRRGQLYSTPRHPSCLYSTSALTRFRRCGTSSFFLNRMDWGVTSTSSSSSI